MLKSNLFKKKIVCGVCVYYCFKFYYCLVWPLVLIDGEGLIILIEILKPYASHVGRKKRVPEEFIHMINRRHCDGWLVCCKRIGWFFPKDTTLLTIILKASDRIVL